MYLGKFFRVLRANFDESCRSKDEAPERRLEGGAPEHRSEGEAPERGSKKVKPPSVGVTPRLLLKAELLCICAIPWISR
jgi:hypothetical protein